MDSKKQRFPIGGDWQSGKTLGQCNLEMLRNSLLADVTFLIGKKQHVRKAHKYVLVSRSQEFYRLFCEEGVTDDVVLEDLEPDVFDHVIRFVYCDEIELTTKNVTAILYAAKKFCLGALVTRCMEKLTDGIGAETVCGILEQAHYFSEAELQVKCLDYINTHAHLVLKSPSFTDLCANCMEKIITSDDLRADEMRVYEAVCAWATKECRRQRLSCNDDNRRRVLGSLKYLIRFPVMDIDYFTNVVSSQEILTKDEKISLFQYLHSRTSPSVVPFKSTRRSLTRALRFETTSGSWNVGEFTDALQFQASRDISVAGVVVFGCCRGRSQYDVSVQITDEDEEKILGQRDAIIETEAKTDYYDVMFIQSTRIKAQRWYTLLVHMSGPNTKRGVKGRAMVYCEQLQFVFQTSSRGKNCTTEKEGQIAGILFHD